MTRALIRAVGLDLLGRDIGEPPWVSRVMIETGAESTLRAEVHEGGAE